MAALHANSFVFIKDDSAVDAGVWVIGFGGGDGFGRGFFSLRRNSGKGIVFHSAATGGRHHAAAPAAAFHWGRGLGSDSLGGSEFGLVQFGALAAMGARHDGALKIERVFQMLAAGLAGAFIHSGRTHSRGY